VHFIRDGGKMLFYFILSGFCSLEQNIVAQLLTVILGFSQYYSVVAQNV
jgi:hypothetical protein